MPTISQNAHLNPANAHAWFAIVCTVQDPPNEDHDTAHIIQVGTGNSQEWNKMWTVADVWAAIDEGHVFYTKDPKTLLEAIVEKYRCRTCGLDTLRSKADRSTANNLDNLPRCRR